jgi:sugar (pentulose or hexulose) kinase
VRAGIVIGLDIGTSGVRVALVDAIGERVGFGAASMSAERLRDPEGWWAAVEQAFAALRETADLSGVRAIACDGTSGTLLAIDAAGRPLASAQMYYDRAEAALVRQIEAIAPAESAAHGATSPLARLLVLQRLPGIARVLHQADWIAGRLTGRYDFSDVNNALKTGYDPIAGIWPDWFEPLGVRRTLLPQVREPGAPIGPVGVAARALGLPRTTLLVAGTTDGCAAFLATGATQLVSRRSDYDVLIQSKNG